MFCCGNSQIMVYYDMRDISLQPDRTERTKNAKNKERYKIYIK